MINNIQKLNDIHREKGELAAVTAMLSKLHSKLNGDMQRCIINGDNGGAAAYLEVLKWINDELGVIANRLNEMVVIQQNIFKEIGL